MGITDAIRKVGSGAANIGKAVMNAVAPQPQPAQQPALADAPSMPDITLPDLGPAPDPNDPKYNSDTSPAGQYEQDAADYQHKKEIHDAFSELDRIYTEAHPNRDFKGEYAQELAALSKDQNYAPQGSFLKRFALSLGDFNPAVKESNVAAFDQNESNQTKRHDYFEAKKLDLQSKMHQQQAQDAEAKGNWKKALAENQALQMMEYDKGRQTQADKIALETAKADAEKERAQIRQEGITRAAQIAASSRLGGATKGSAYDQLVKALITNWAKNYAPQGIMNTPSTYTLHDIIDQMDTFKEEIAHPGSTKPPATPAPASAPAKAAGSPDDKVLIERDGHKGTISRKFVKPTDKVLGPAPAQ